MHLKKDFKNIDSLIQGIRTILTSDRCSLSDEEKVHLNNTISYLENSKKEDDKKSIDWSLVMKGFELLFKVFTNLDDFPDIF